MCEISTHNGINKHTSPFSNKMHCTLGSYHGTPGMRQTKDPKQLMSLTHTNIHKHTLSQQTGNDTHVI